MTSLHQAVRPQARADRHQGHRQARLWRRHAGARRLVPGVLGLWRHPTIGRGNVEARILHHPRARLHAGDRSPEFAARRPLTIKVDYMTNHVQVT